MYRTIAGYRYVSFLSMYCIHLVQNLKGIKEHIEQWSSTFLAPGISFKESHIFKYRNTKTEKEKVK